MPHLAAVYYCTACVHRCTLHERCTLHSYVGLLVLVMASSGNSFATSFLSARRSWWVLHALLWCLVLTGHPSQMTKALKNIQRALRTAQILHKFIFVHRLCTGQNFGNFMVFRVERILSLHQSNFLSIMMLWLLHGACVAKTFLVFVFLCVRGRNRVFHCEQLLVYARKNLNFFFLSENLKEHSFFCFCLADSTANRQLHVWSLLWLHWSRFVPVSSLSSVSIVFCTKQCVSRSIWWCRPDKKSSTVNEAKEEDFARNVSAFAIFEMRLLSLICL